MKVVFRNGKGTKTMWLAGMLLLSSVFIFLLVLYLAQDKMIFHNADDSESRAFFRDQKEYEDIEFTASNGKTYHGLLYRTQEDNVPLIIYFGGNGECSYRHMRARCISKTWSYFAGSNFLFVDYEGYGLNQGKASYLNMYEESLAVYDYAVNLPGIDNRRIVSMGYSIGTGCAVYLAAHREVIGLVLVSPYYQGSDLYNRMVPIFYGPMNLLVKQKFPSFEYAKKVSAPTQIIASRADEMIPIASSERLKEHFAGSVTFTMLDYPTHNEIMINDKTLDTIQVFLEEIFKSCNP